MSFVVQPDSLDRYASQASRAAEDSAAVKGYLEGFPTPIGTDGGALIWLIGPSHGDAMTAAIGATNRVSEVLEASETGLKSAARYYRTSDAASAARMDGSLTASRPPTRESRLDRQWATDPCPPSFTDSRDPNGRLTPVADVEYSHPLAFMDNISISNWALKAFKEVLGFNPLERVMEHFAGDWQSIARGGVALGRAGEAMQDLGYNIQGGAIALRDDWSGRASDMAFTHFTRLAHGAADLHDPLKEMSKRFDEIAHGVWSTCESLNGIIKSIVDAAIVAGIAAAAGTVTAETGIGAVVGYGVAAVEVANILRLWAEATKAIQALYGLVQIAVGVIEAQITRLRDVTIPNMSGYTSYRHPMVPDSVGVH
ncbi:hypothetical protein I0C86_20630 [Plantactinospora sp. S1510]|uniref:WXG100 family type VII secretion target n=1 Tax=Plantactinospora alkalitolerans TaxID=2789879 RepID=A0ABS0GYR3_9ACTN|nr:hypothetical protein [Plantactinospora alkalitolerans]MBF9131350.1 hypothetical protein [Plantactinospora alkalitolerans]